MIRPIRHIKHLLLTAFALFAFASCTDMEGEREICDYKVLLRYDYNEENTTTRNMIEYYVYTIDEYIFDENGFLYDYRRITPNVCRDKMNSEWNLPPGKYSVIAIGNQDERSRIYDSQNPAVQKGITRRSDLRMLLDNAPQMTGGTKGPSEKLYHGYRTFTVKQQGISRVRVDMINAHMYIRFRVTWKNNATPARGNGYHATLGTQPSEYSLMPQYIYPAGSFQIENHDSGSHDLYPSNCNNVIHHIPHTVYDGNNPLLHRVDTKINGDNEMWGEFITYRTKLATNPAISIFRTGTGQSVIPKAIELKPYFEYLQHIPDYALKQEYLLDIIIDGDHILISSLDIADWDEGELFSN